MDIHQNTRIRRLVRAGERDGGGSGAAGPRDGELVARHVELGAGGAAGGVEGDDLGAQQVVAGGEVGGDLDVHLPAALVEVLDAPVVAIGRGARRRFRPRVLEDLEPAGRAVGGRGVGHLGHVHQHGAVVGAADGFVGAGALAVLLVHLNCHRRASLDGTLARGTGCAGVATEVVGGNVGDGRVGRWPPGALSCKVDAINPQLLEGGVGGSLLCNESRDRSDGKRLHGDKVSS